VCFGGFFKGTVKAAYPSFAIVVAGWLTAMIRFAKNVLTVAPSCAPAPSRANSSKTGTRITGFDTFGLM
jgi:hypothetical protein